MAQGFLKIFNIEKDESASVLILLGLSMFLGVFEGVFEVGASALFLEQFEARMIPKAYLISGLVGIIMTSIYSRAQHKIPFSRLAIYNLLIIALLTFFMRFSFAFVQSKWLIFFIFVMMGPLRIVAFVGFWGTVGRIFTLRQGKRLFGLIDSGWVFGIIISSYLIPVLLTIGIGTRNLFYICGFSIFFGLIFQALITGKTNLKNAVATGQEAEDSQESNKEKNLFQLLKNNFVLFMSVFVILSMMSLFFIQYTFLSVAHEQYPDSTELAMFLGVFNGTMMIFTILVKTMVYSKMVKTYGLKLVLAISPILLCVFGIIASLIGTFVGFDAAAGNFAFFFLIISLTKLFSKALKDSIEVPSFKILYQSLDKRVRYDVQARVDGTINEIAAVTAGLVLVILSALDFIKIIHFIYVLVFILIIWSIVSFRLYNEYKSALRASLSRFKNMRKAIREDNQLVKILQEIDSAVPERVIYLLRLARLIYPYKYLSILGDLLMKNTSEGIKEFIFTEYEKYDMPEAIGFLKEYLNQEKDETFRERAHQVIQALTEDIQTKMSPALIYKLSNSRNWKKRVQSIHLIDEIKDKRNEFIQAISKLLRDVEPRVKVEAIKVASHVYNEDIVNYLIDMLEDPLYGHYAAEALESIGDNAVEQMQLAYNKTGMQTKGLIQVTKILGNVRGKKAIETLLHNLEGMNREIVHESLVALKKSGYKNDHENQQIQQSIKDTIGSIAWIYTAQVSMGSTGKLPDLKEALEDELKENYDKLFLLLSLSYDPGSIEQVRENLESGTAEGIGYAIELLDLFVVDELKPFLFPIFEDNTKVEKLKQLEAYFPLQTWTYRELVNEITNRDLNQVTHWTKACAIYSLLAANEKDRYISDDIVAHLFNPDALLRETAALVTRDIDPERYENVFLRLSAKLQKDLKTRLKAIDEGKHYPLVERVLLLKNKKGFQEIHGELIYELANEMRLFHVENGKKYMLADTPFALLLAYKGEVLLRDNEHVDNEIMEKSIMNLYKINNYQLNNYYLEAEKDVAIFGIEQNAFNKILFHHPEIAGFFMN